MRKYIHRIISIIISLNLMVSLSMCTSEGISINEIEFFIAKEWKIESVIVNGNTVTDTDLSQYRLILNEDFTFKRITIDGQEEAGNWQLTAGLSQVVIFVDDPREESYLLLDLEVRRLEMRLLQESFKDGQLDIRYILVPVKGQ
jgi:hypothetical protein